MSEQKAQHGCTFKPLMRNFDTNWPKLIVSPTHPLRIHGYIWGPPFCGETIKPTKRTSSSGTSCCLYIALYKRIHSKKLLGAPGLTTRSKDATRGSWHRYERSVLTTSNKKPAKGLPHTLLAWTRLPTRTARRTPDRTPPDLRPWGRYQASVSPNPGQTMHGLLAQTGTARSERMREKMREARREQHGTTQQIRIWLAF